MKKTIKRLSATVIIAALVFTVLGTGTAEFETPAAMSADVLPSESREEVVYANLGSDGAAKEINVVTILHNSAPAAVADYGSYTAVKNLTDTTPVNLTEDAVLLSAPKGDFYYQGTLKSTALPWNISIVYYLDGKELAASELAGKTGHIEIRLGTTANMQVDPSYFDNYLLQISMTLDASKCTNISASGGTIANAGKNKLVTYAVMPGKNSDISLDADVTDFSMAGISLAAVPLSMKIDMPDTSGMLGDLTKLSDAVASLKDGIAKLKSGTSDLKDGAADLQSGSASFAGGLKKLDDNAVNLVGGSTQIRDALKAIAASLKGPPGSLNLGDMSQLPAGLSQLATGLEGISSGLTDLKTGYAASYEALKTAINSIPAGTIPQEDINKLYQDNADKKDTLDKLVAFYAAGAQTKATYESVKPAFDAVVQTLDQCTASINEISGALSSTSGQIKTALSSNDTVSQLTQLSAGLTELSDRYTSFHQGLTDYAAGVTKLDGNYGSLNAGISGIAGGTNDLYGGISKTYDGTVKLSDGLTDMPDKVNEEINKLMSAYDKSGFKPVSFVSDKNINTDSVQFILKTEKIEKAEAPAAAAAQPDNDSIWTRFLALFK